MIYFLFFTLSIVIARYSQFRTKVNKFGLFVSLMVLVLMAGLRDDTIGTDTSAYVLGVFTKLTNIHHYKEFRFFLEDIEIEKLYVIYGYIVTRITNNFNEYLLYLHLLMYATMFYAFYKLRNQLSVWLCVFILSFVFYRETLNLQRQCVALAICLLSYSYLICNNYKKSLFFVPIAFGFHHSSFSFVAIIVMKYVFDKYYDKLDAFWLKAVLVICLAIILMSLAFFIGFFEDLGLIGDKYEIYLNDDKYESNVPKSGFAIAIINLLLFYVIKKRNKRDSFLVMNEYLFIAAIIFCFAGLISKYTGRIGYYITYLSIINIPILYCNYYQIKFCRKFHLFFYLFYWYMCTIVANLGGTYPYTSNILGI